MKGSAAQSRSVKVLALLFANGVNILIGFLTMPYLARSLSYEEYGTYGQVLLIGTIFTVIFGLGSTQVINVIYAENEGKEDRVFSSNFWLFLISGVLAALAVGVFRYQIADVLNNEALADLLLLYAPCILFTVAATVYTTSIVYFGKVKELAVVTVATNILRITLLVIAITYYRSLSLAIIALGVGAFIQALWYLFSVPSEHRSFASFDSKILLDQLHISFPMLLVALFGAGVLNIDGIIVSSILGVKEFAIYRAGAIELPFIGTICSTVATVIMPDLAKLAFAGNGKEIFTLNRKASNITAFIVIPTAMFLIFFGEEFITLYLSERYAESGLIFSIYTCAVLARIIIYQSIPLAYKKTKAILIGFLGGLVLSTTANLIFVGRYGAIAAAVAYVVTQLFLIIYLIMVSSRITGQSPRGFFDWSFLVSLLCFSALTACASFILHCIYQSYLLLAGLAVLYGIAIIVFVRYWRKDIFDVVVSLALHRLKPA